MKKMRFSFATAVAVLAIGVTIAAQAGAFEAKAAFAETDCFTNTIEFKPVDQCDQPLQTIVENDPCNIIAVDDHIFSLGAIVSNPETACPGGNDFCCLYVVEDDAPCSDQDQLDLGSGLKFYKVGRTTTPVIRCEP